MGNSGQHESKDLDVRILEEVLMLRRAKKEAWLKLGKNGGLRIGG